MRVVTWPMIALVALVDRDLPGLVVPDEKKQTASAGSPTERAPNLSGPRGSPGMPQHGSDRIALGRARLLDRCR